MEIYDNPLVPQRADPWVYRHTDGWYYFTASVPEYDGIELRRAKTLNGLAKAATRTVWQKHQSGGMSHLIWAPELHYIDGRWYIYFSASPSDEVLEHRIFALECEGDPMESEWKELGMMDTGDDTFALDATSFEHGGARYFVWAQLDEAIPGHSNIYISKMSGPARLTGKRTMLTSPELPWECIGFLVNEGPAVVNHGGRIFITYSASATDRNYCMGLLWADEGSDLLDASSWHKSPRPVFSTCDENSQYGPGHNSFTTAEDGSDVLIYHSRSYEKIIGDPLYDHNRHARAKAFEWDENGMPVFGKPLPENV